MEPQMNAVGATEDPGVRGPKGQKIRRSADQVRRLKGLRLGASAPLILCVLLLTGCQRTIVSDALPMGGDSEMAYWHGLPDRPVVSNDEALHGLILLVNGEDPSESYEQRVEWLKERKLLSSGFKKPAPEAVECGTVAQVVARHLDIKGGLSMRLLGAHPRYAVRELVYLQIMRPATPQQALRGIDFMGIISKAEAYKEEGT
jgi:hypothetical protein